MNVRERKSQIEKRSINKDTSITSIDVVLVSLVLTLNRYLSTGVMGLVNSDMAYYITVM